MFKYLLQHIILDTAYFPIWWYTKGFHKTYKWAGESLKDIERTVGLKIWLKAMFKPMFQDYTRSGRIVSFFMRVILLIFKFLFMLIWTIFLGAILLLWLLLIPITVILLLISFGYDLIY